MLNMMMRADAICARIRRASQAGEQLICDADSEMFGRSTADRRPRTRRRILAHIASAAHHHVSMNDDPIFACAAIEIAPRAMSPSPEIRTTC